MHGPIPYHCSTAHPLFFGAILFCETSSRVYLSSRKEIRQAGILRGGQLIRWGSIRSWTWLPRRAAGKDSGFVTLKLDLYHSMPLFAMARLIITASEKENVEAILARQLGKWPA